MSKTKTRRITGLASEWARKSLRGLQPKSIYDLVTKVRRKTGKQLSWGTATRIFQEFRGVVKSPHNVWKRSAKGGRTGDLRPATPELFCVVTKDLGAKKEIIVYTDRDLAARKIGELLHTNKHAKLLRAHEAPFSVDFKVDLN